MVKRSKLPAGLAARDAVLVLGMQRSGTSALAGSLSKLGCAPPRSLMGANTHNAKGYYESTKVWRFNEDLLKSAGSYWHDFTPFNPDWMTSSASIAYLDRAASILEEEFGSEALFVLKDPRICRLVEFWIQALKKTGCQVKPIITVRSPMEVSASLERFQGFSKPYGQMLWLRSVLDSERHTRTLPRYFTSYDRLLHRWPRVLSDAGKELGISWPRGIAQAEMEIDSFLSSDLRHHQERSEDILDNPLLINWLRDAYAIFMRWAESGEDRADHATLDAIRTSFDVSSQAFARVVMAEREESRVLSGRIAEISAEKTVLQTKIDKHESTLLDERQQTQTALRDSATARERADEALAAQAGDAARLAELDADLKKKIQSVKILQASVATLEGELEALRSAQASQRAALDEERAVSHGLRAELIARGTAQTDSDTRTQDIARLTLLLDEQFSETERHRLDLQRAQGVAEARDKELATLSLAVIAGDREAERLGAALRAAEARDETRLADLTAVHDELAQVRSALVQRQHETEMTAAALAEARSAATQQDTVLAALRQQLGEQDTALEARERALTEIRRTMTREAEAAARHIADLEALRARNEQLQDGMQDRFREVATLTQLAMRQQAEIDALKELGTALNDTLRAAQDRAGAEQATLTQELATLKADLLQSQQDRDGARQEVHDLRASTSWRITGPLRRIVLLLRRR